MINELRDMTVGSEIEIENRGWRINGILNSIHNLQAYLGQEYLVDGKDNMILVRRIK